MKIFLILQKIMIGLRNLKIVLNTILMVVLLLSPLFLISCSNNHSSEFSASVLDSLRQIGSTEGFKPYSGNPVIKPGPKGSWDAGALGSMTIVKAKGVFHMYYEAWGVRTNKDWDTAEYETLQIGHATSKDGIHWKKDPLNPVLKHGKKGDWDATGVWDPYVIYKNGVFKMWYGGGGGNKPNFGWGFAVSKDGTHFKKYGLIGTHNLSGVEDDHVVHDKESGLYYMYYWHGYDDGKEGPFCVTSPTDTGFDFSKAVLIHINGDNSFWCKFCQVLKNNEGWHMFYSNYVGAHGPNSIVRIAGSKDGIHWQAENKRLLRGQDAEVLQVTHDLYLMAFAPQGYFDRKDADIRIAVYNGTLSALTSKPVFVKVNGPAPISGKKFTVNLGKDGFHRFHFKPEGEVIISNKDGYTYPEYYKQEGDSIHIMGEQLNLQAIYRNGKLKLK